MYLVTKHKLPHYFIGITDDHFVVVCIRMNRSFETFFLLDILHETAVTNCKIMSTRQAPQNQWTVQSNKQTTIKYNTWIIVQYWTWMMEVAAVRAVATNYFMGGPMWAGTEEDYRCLKVTFSTFWKQNQHISCVTRWFFWNNKAHLQQSQQW